MDDNIVAQVRRQESRRVFSTLVRRLGSFEAAEDAVHDESPSAAVTDWPQIVGLYDALLRLEPSPVIGPRRAVAVGMRDGPKAGLALIKPLLPALAGCHATGPSPTARRTRRWASLRAGAPAPASWPNWQPRCEVALPGLPRRRTLGRLRRRRVR